jgi:hypothetical protein
MPRTIRIVACLLCICLAQAFTPRDTGHCLTWAKSTGLDDNVQTTLFSAAPDGSPLCRPLSAASGSTAVSFPSLGLISSSEESLTLPVGTVDVASGVCAVVGGEVTGNYEVAIIEPSCTVWWRTFSEDVIPPMSELVMHFGTAYHESADSSEAFKVLFGLCRVPDGRIGTLTLTGSDVGRCVVVDDHPLELRGGGFDAVQARETIRCENDPKHARIMSLRLEKLVDEHLNEADRLQMESITGFAFADLIDDLLAMPSCELSAVLSSANFIPHALNVKGLTLLRHILARRMYKARLQADGSTAHPDFVTFQRDGILVKNLDKLTSDEVVGLLRMVSGEMNAGSLLEQGWTEGGELKWYAEMLVVPHIFPCFVSQRPFVYSI